MKTLFLDAFAGISGDMMLGLLVDLGVSRDFLEKELSLLPLTGFHLSAQPDQRHGIGGTRVQVYCGPDQPRRTWSDIDRLLADSALSAPARDLSRKIFRLLGEAEAEVHQVELDQVHFHEVGALDAIVDIVGSAVGLIQLDVERVVCSPLPLSHGLTSGEHGRLPLPAPATLEILRGSPVRPAGSDRELVTPTGAAIARAIAEFGELPAMTLERSGYGVGGWQLEDRPNLLRGLLGRAAADGLLQDTAVVLETHIDDMAPELLGGLLDDLLADGAWDAAFSPLQMKKNRPGIRLTVVAPPARQASLARRLLRETTTTGVRCQETRRYKLRREIARVATAAGEAQVKLIYEGDQLLRTAPEHASCQALARTTGRPLADIYRLVDEAARRQFGLEV